MLRLLFQNSDHDSTYLSFLDDFKYHHLSPKGSLKTRNRKESSNDF